LLISFSFSSALAFIRERVPFFIINIERLLNCPSSHNNNVDPMPEYCLFLTTGVNLKVLIDSLRNALCRLNETYFTDNVVVVISSLLAG